MATKDRNSSPPIQDSDQHEKRTFHFLAMGVVLMAMAFGLVHAIDYFLDRFGATAGNPTKAETGITDKAMIVLP